MNETLAVEIGRLEQALYDNEKYIRIQEEKVKKGKGSRRTGIIAMVIGGLLTVVTLGSILMLFGLLLFGAGLLSFATGWANAAEAEHELQSSEERLRKVRMSLSMKRTELAGK